VEEAQEYIWHDDNDRADPNRSCYRNPLQQELDESKEAFDEEDVVYAMEALWRFCCRPSPSGTTRSDVVMKCASISAEELMQAESRCLVRKVEVQVNDGGEDVSDDVDECVAKIFNCQIQIVSTAAP
jgi:hypothetical protein